MSSITSKQKRSIDVQGSKISLARNYGGLGARYYDQLGHQLDRISQVDTTTGITETKGSIRGRSIQLALEMKNRGVDDHDIIVISSRNHADQTIVVLATLFLGAIVAPLDPDFSYTECLDLIKVLKPKMCFCDTRTVSQMERILTTLNYSSELVHFGLRNGVALQFCKLFAHKEAEYFQPVFIEDPLMAVAFILPSQGTCGVPKLVCLSHQNIYMQTMIFLEVFNYPEKVISFFPLSWILQTVLTCVSFETTMIRILPGPFTERGACKIIHDFDIGYAIFGTDYAMRTVSNVAIKDFNLHCLKCMMIGTVNTTKHNIQMLRTLLPHVKFLQCYCLAETGFIAASSVLNYDIALRKPNSVGRLTLNCKIKIMDLETKENLDANKYGELYFNGDGIMLGYFKDPQKTTSMMEKSFFKTGDYAMYDEEGWLYVKGRVEDIIPLSPLCSFDLENITLNHPYVRDAVVIGNDKEIVICILLKGEKILTSEKLLKFISERVPDTNCMPNRIIFMDNFPRTSIGNVKKRLLREDILTIKIQYASSLASMENNQ